MTLVHTQHGSHLSDAASQLPPRALQTLVHFPVWNRVGSLNMRFVWVILWRLRECLPILSHCRCWKISQLPACSSCNPASAFWLTWPWEFWHTSYLFPVPSSQMPSLTESPPSDSGLEHLPFWHSTPYGPSRKLSFLLSTLAISASSLNTHCAHGHTCNSLWWLASLFPVFDDKFKVR